MNDSPKKRRTPDQVAALRERMTKKTYIIRSTKDQGVYKKGEVIRTVTLENGEDPATLRNGLMYEVTVAELGIFNRTVELMFLRSTEKNRLKNRLEKLNKKAFALLGTYCEQEYTSWHSVQMTLVRKAIFDHYFENYTS